jgi:putative transposase
LWFQGRWYYLATLIDLFSRQVVGWTLSAHHDTDLITAALLDALSRHPPPAICHQDQYCSERYDIIALSLGIELSFSEKGSPWENGFQESFYRPFKLEIHAKKLDRFADLGELMAAIAKQIQYYKYGAHS